MTDKIFKSAKKVINIGGTQYELVPIIIGRNQTKLLALREINYTGTEITQ